VQPSSGAEGRGCRTNGGEVRHHAGKEKGRRGGPGGKGKETTRPTIVRSPTGQLQLGRKATVAASTSLQSARRPDIPGSVNL